MAQEKRDAVDARTGDPHVIEVVRKDPAGPTGTTPSYHTELDNAPAQQTSGSHGALDRASGVASKVAGDIADRVHSSAGSVAEKMSMSSGSPGLMERLRSWVASDPEMALGAALGLGLLVGFVLRRTLFISPMEMMEVRARG